MKHPDAAAHTSFSRHFRFRSFFVCLVVLLLAVFTLFQTGERIVKADRSQDTSLFIAPINLLHLTTTPCSTPGTLDTSFNGTGKVTTPFGTFEDYANSVAIQSDGKVVTAGYANTAPSQQDFAVVRYNTNGTLDTSFNGTGKVTTPIGSSTDLAYSVAIQSDGKIVVAGSSFSGSKYNFAVVRYNSGGTLDTTFNGTGKVTTSIDSNDNDAYSVAIQADGKIVAAGTSVQGFVVVRYNTNGSLDTSFNGSGKVTTPFAGGSPRAESVAIQADGRIVAAGSSYNGSNSDFALVRLNTNGTLDTSFNGTGKVTTPIGSGGDGASSMAVQPDGRIVAAGSSNNGSNSDFALVRYNSNGTLDTSFNGTGKVTTPIGSSSDVADSVAIQPDGKIVAAGYSVIASPDFALVRYNTDGMLDTSFNGTGKVTTSIGSGHDLARSVAIQSDGNIVVAGSSDMGSTNYDFALVRYNGAACSFQTPTPTNTPTATPTATATACPNGTPGNAYLDTILVPRAGPNGPTGVGNDGLPLGNRTPVILVHGIHGNRQNGADTVQDPAVNLNFKYFEKLIGSLNGDVTEYTQRFKTYSFHYVSDIHTAQEIGQALRDRIDERAEFANKSVIVVAHSMGGIVARHYLLQPTSGGPFPCQQSGNRVDKLISLATLHHGTYGANGSVRVDDEFPDNQQAAATTIFTAGDLYYWWRRNGCFGCVPSWETQHPNRGTLLWDNFDNRFSEDLLNQFPWERHYDLPNTTAYNNKIIAYWGEISPSWRLTNASTQALLGMIAQGGEGAGEDKALAGAAYLIEAVDWGSLSNVPAPQNDGLVPVESARFDGATLAPNGRIHCPGYNHRNMKDGDGEDIQNNNLVQRCSDGNTLFNSVRYRITGVSVTSPSLCVGPDGAGFGSHNYTVARPAGSAPVSTIDVPLSNLGDAALQITSLSLAGANADQFVIVNPPPLPLTIGAESSVHITVGFNPTSPGEKTAELRAVNSSSNSVVVVNISATGVPEECDLNFSPASQFMPTSGGSGEVMVGNISCPWTVSALDDWIHPTALADRISFSVDANAAADVRYGTMIVSVYGRSYLYSISQDAANAPCWMQLSSDQSVVQREAGGGNFYITAPGSCGWSFQSDSPWLIPSIGTLQGSGSVGFTAEANTGADRSGIITIQGSAMSAQYTVHQRGASITGTVTYGNATAPPKYISNVTVTATGEPNITTVTGAPGETAGQYQLSGFGAGSYTVSLSKTTGQNGISSLDAARIAQHVSGAVFLTTDNQKASADVSNNGAISSFDAAQIANFVATGSSAGLAGQWRFFVPPGPTFPVGASPTSRTYPSIASNISGDDYIGLLMGEVTGNWNPTAARPAGIVESGKWKVDSEGIGPERGIAVELSSVAGSVDKEIIVPVNVQGIADKGVISYEFDLRYDPTVMQPLVEPVDVAGTVSRGLSVVTNATEPGLLRIVVYGAYPIDCDGVLLNLRFAAVGSVGSISDLKFENLIFNEGEPHVLVTDGKIELLD